METPGDEVDMSDHEIERLSAGSRATVEDPPYDAADAALLRAASQRARTRLLPCLVYAVAAGVLAALLKTAALAQIPSELDCATAAAVDLNAPGALAGLKVGRPGDYAKIIGIIAGVTRHPELDVARWISTTFHAEDVSYFPLWLTSLPPRRRLSFCLQGTRYDVVLTITHDGARLSPTDYPSNPRAPAGSISQGAHGAHAAAPP